VETTHGLAADHLRSILSSTDKDHRLGMLLVTPDQRDRPHGWFLGILMQSLGTDLADVGSLQLGLELSITTPCDGRSSEASCAWLACSNNVLCVILHRSKLAQA
jgi:hypothetical protein